MTSTPRARIVGALQSQRIHKQDASAATEHREVVFDQGYVRHDATVDVARDGHVLCAAWGNPRFTSPDALRLARSAGNAAAWLASFVRDGPAAPHAVHGRFAVAMLRPQDGVAWLACDRFATWPLCFAAEGAELTFSDRADEVPVAERRLSLQALFDYFYFHCIPGPRTVIEGVARVPPATLVRFERGTLRHECYWRPQFVEPAAADLPALSEEFRRIVQRSVEHEAVGHEVAAFLSGGTDSSTVAGMLCRVLGRPARTYSIGFDAPGYDEMHYARVAAKHFGTEHHEHYVTPDEVLAGMPLLAAHYDQPFGNSSVLPTWICAARARADGVDKLLAGDGGDELFGGNQRYVRHGLLAHYETLPRMIRRVVTPVATHPLLRRLPVLRKAGSYVEQASVPLPERLQVSNLLMYLKPANVFTTAFLAHVECNAPVELQKETWQLHNTPSALNRLLAFEWKYTLADNDLPKVVGATGLAGVDVGFPLLADELVEFSTRLPVHWKVRGLTLRWFFKQALRGFLPDEIIAKRKHGFGLPFGYWVLRNERLRTRADAVLASLAERGVIRPEFLRDLLTTWLPAQPGYYGEMLWICMIKEHWLQSHAPHWRLAG